MPYLIMKESEVPQEPKQDQFSAAPFSPGPPESSGGGCGRVGLIGCGLLVLLLGAASVVFLLKAGDLFAWAMDRFEVEIAHALPDDLPEADRRRLHNAFEAASDAVRAGDFDPLALQKLQSKLRDSLLEESQNLTRQQVLELIAILEEVAGDDVEDESGEGKEEPLSPVAAPSTT